MILSLYNDLLSTKIIASLKTEGRTVSYFYFDTLSQSKDKTTYRSLLSSLLLHIGLQFNQDELKDLYQKYDSGRSQITTDAMKTTIIKLLTSAADAYILIDAIDECESKDQHLVAVFISELLRLGPRIHILASCRYSVSSMGVITTGQKVYEIQLVEGVVNGDIQKHIQKALNEFEFPEIMKEVEEALLAGAHGQ